MKDDTQPTSKVKRVYDALNIKYKTKEEIDKVYYKLKVDKGYKSFDDFINEILKFFKEKNELQD